MKTTECAIRYAMSKYCTVTKQGRTNHVEMSVPPAIAQQMLIYLLKKGCTEDNLANTFKRLQQEAMNLANTQAKAGKSNAGLWFFVLLILSMGCALVFVSDLPYFVLPIAVLIAFSIAWLTLSPRSKAIDECWAASNQEDILPALETIDKLYATSQWTIAMEKYRTKTLILAAVAIIAFVGTAGLAVTVEVQAAQYHATFSESVDLLHMTGSNGTRFVVYDTDAQRYINTSYLPDEYKAATPDDVAAVLMVDVSKRVVGTYSGGGNAYQYVYSLSLRSCKDGTEYGSLKVYGGDPPQTIRTRIFSTNHSATGSKPNDSSLWEACEKLITLFEIDQ